MGHPLSDIKFGVPYLSYNGKRCTGFPQGDKPGGAGHGTTSGRTVTVTGPSASGSVGGSGAGLIFDAGFNGPATPWEIGAEIEVNRPAGGFGTKPKGHLPTHYYEHSTDLLPHPTLCRASVGDIDQIYGNSYSTTDHPPNSVGARRVVMNDPAGHSSVGYIFPVPTMEVRHFSHVKYNYDIINDAVSTNLKFKRARASINNGVPNTYWNAHYGASTTGINFASDGAGSEYHVTALHNSYMPGVSEDVWPEGITMRWHSQDSYIRASSAPGAANGQGILYVDGARIYYYPETVLPGVRDTVGFRTNTDADFIGFGSTYESQVSNNLEPAGSYVYYGGTLIDDSAHMVYLTDSPTWNTSAAIRVEVDFLVITFWSNTRIKFYVRPTIHASQAGKWVWTMLGDGLTVMRLGQVPTTP